MVRGASPAGAMWRAIQRSVDEVGAVARKEARKAIDAFRSYGSTAPAEVDRQIARWKQVLTEDG